MGFSYMIKALLRGHGVHRPTILTPPSPWHLDPSLYNLLC